MNERRKRIFSIIALIVLVIFILSSMIMPLFMTAQADDLSNLQGQYKGLQQQQQEIGAMIQANQKGQQDLSAKKAGIDQNIALLQQQINVLRQSIGLLDTRIGEKEEVLARTQQEYDANRQLFKERLRALYIDGNESYLDVLLSATSITDFLMKAEVLHDISVYDNRLLQSLQTGMDQIKQQTAAIVKDRDSLSSAQNDLKTRQTDLKQQSQQSAQMLATLKNIENQLKAQNASVDAKEKSANAAIAKMILEQLQSKQAYSGVTSGNFLWPIQGLETYISSGYGPRHGHSYPHTGVDISAEDIYGHPIAAAADGQVVFASYDSIYGNCVILNNGLNKDGQYVLTLYGHACRFADGIVPGAEVKRGQTLSYVGSTGNSTGPHLHFQVMLCGENMLKANAGSISFADLRIDVNPLSFVYTNMDCINIDYYKSHGNDDYPYIKTNWPETFRSASSDSKDTSDSKSES